MKIGRTILSTLETTIPVRRDANRFDPAPVCPACRSPLDRGPGGFACEPCGRSFPNVVGLTDLRLASDAYLSLADERAKAERLERFAPTTDVLGVARAYYAMTDDVDDRRRARFLAHIAGAELRGEVLAGMLPREGRILEVGCGTGGLLVAASRRGIAIQGSDIATRWLVVARRRLADRGLSVPLVGAQAERLPWPDASFDALVADSILEHLEDPLEALREWRRVVRPGGRLLVWSPNRMSILTDPHVGLWGLGWMPRAVVPPYVRWRRGIPWMVRPLSTSEAARFATEAGWIQARADPAPVSATMGRGRASRLGIGAYDWLRRQPSTRGWLGRFGPLWQLTAVRGEA